MNLKILMTAVTPTSEQKEAIDKLREALKAADALDPERHTDRLLFKFLKARRFDHEKASKMILDCEKWRKDFHVVELTKSFSYEEEDAMHELYPRFYHKTDKKGRPIYIERFFNMDVKKIYKLTDQDRLIKRHVRDYEKLCNYRFPACEAAHGDRVEQTCSILDLKDVPLSQFNEVRKFLQSVSAIASDYYPETLGKMFIINAPMLFTAIWAIVKTMLDEQTVAKISVLGSNYQKELLEHIELQNLPKILGGNCQCANGCDHSDTGPWNNGTAPGYPIAFWEDFKVRDKSKY